MTNRWLNAFALAAPALSVVQHGYRPIDPEILKKHSAMPPPMELFPFTAIAKGWEDTQQKFFVDNSIFDMIYAP